MNQDYSSILAQELEPLNAQIETIRSRLETLEGELRATEDELEAFSGDRERYTALQDVCNALRHLDEIDAGSLFWGELQGDENPADLLATLERQVEQFEESIRGTVEQKENLTAKVNDCYAELGFLEDEVMEAHAREEQRRDEFIIEREVEAFPIRIAVMPWSKQTESERRLRRAVLVALLLCFIFGSIIPMINVPVPDRSQTVVEIPERLAMLVKKEPPRPEPPPVRELPTEEKAPEPEKKKEVKKEKPKPESKPKTEVAETRKTKKEARKKAESTGVLAFKESFKDLIEDPPVAKLGTEARINNKAPLAAGQARPQRSLVAAQATGTSGGIRNSTVSRNLGAGGTGGNGDRIGGVAFARVESAVAELAEEGRPLSDGPGPARTDEEIQIVFDRYKATLYRIYNKELRKDPTLRGKLLLRLTIEPGGEVSLCEADSTDLASPELVTKIIARVKRFNFGAKDEVPQVTILYPIDFLPAG